MTTADTHTYDPDEIEAAFIHLQRTTDFTPGNGEIPSEITSEAGWAAYDWTRTRQGPHGHRRRGASPKPTWAALRAAWVVTRAAHWAGTAWVSYLGPTGTLRKAEDEIAHEPLSVPGVGEGIDVATAGLTQLGALVHKHARSGDAGVAFRRSVIRAGESDAVSLWHEGQLARYLEAAVEARDQARSAANLLREEMAGLRATATDLDKTESERAAAIRALDAIRGDWAGAVRRHRAALDPGVLPSDADLAREVLCDQVEARAAEREAFIRGSASRQGAFGEAPCPEMRSALIGIAKERARALRDLFRLGGVTEMRARVVEAVRVMGIQQVDAAPAWKTVAGKAVGGITGPGTQHVAAFGYDPDAAGPQAVVTLRAENPREANAETAGAVAITGATLADGYACDRHTPPKAKWQEITIRYTGTGAPAPGLAANLVARNGCGPAVLAVHITIAARSAEE